MMKRASTATALLSFLLLSGCESWTVIFPSGDIASQLSNLIIYSVVLMLLVIVPVIALTIFFAIKYRASNENANYEPEWHHSTSLEVVVWSVPMAIIIMLAGLTWVATHRLDPYQPLTRISEDQPIDESVEPLVIQVAAMDWKWLFIYPEYDIASINELAAPLDRPIEFQITSLTVMNSFFIPALAGQIYAMNGMQTELNAVVNEPGTFHGFAANYSGEGFSHMNFDFLGLEQEGFDAWIEEVRADTHVLDREEMIHLMEHSINHPVTYFGEVEDTLWDRIINACIEEDALCRNDMAMVDALGGGGLAGLYNRELYRGICSAEDPGALIAILRPDLRMREGEILAAASLLPPAEERLN